MSPTRILRLLALAVGIFSLCAVAVPRDAEAVSLAFNNRWKLGFSHNQVDLGAQSGGLAGNGRGMSIMNTGMGVQTHIGVGFGRGDGIIIFLGLGLNRLQSVHSYEDADAWSIISSQFGLRIGGKFHITEPRRAKASPYVLVDFYKYFSTVYEDVDGVSNDIEYQRQQTNSPLGFELAFGAEYFFNDQFSIGGEFIGFDFSYSGHRGDSDLDDVYEDRFAFSIFTAFTLNYRFSFSLRASVEYESDYDYDYDD